MLIYTLIFITLLSHKIASIYVDDLKRCKNKSGLPNSGHKERALILNSPQHLPLSQTPSSKSGSTEPNLVSKVCHHVRQPILINPNVQVICSAGSVLASLLPHELGHVSLPH